MKKSITKVLAVLLSVMMFFTMLPLNGYAETTTPEKVVAKLNNRGFKKVVDFGWAADSPSLTSAVYGKENGRDVVYTTANGGKFNVVDVKSNERLFVQQLEGVSQTWSHSIAPDGTVYIAALGPSNVGELWSYSPTAKSVTKIGKVEANGEQVWSSTVDEAGNVYIGTYSASGAGKVIKYDVSKKEFISLGEIDSECGYVRSLAYHNGYIYAGLGVAGKVYRIDIATGTKENITKNVPDLVGKKLADIKFCYDMTVVDNKYLFARFDDGDGIANYNTLLFYDLEAQKWLDVKLTGSGAGGKGVGVFGFNQIPVYNNMAYVSYNKQLEEIDLASLSSTTTSAAITTSPAAIVTRSTGIGYGAAFRGGAFVNLGTDSEPVMALSTIKRDGNIFLVKDIAYAKDTDKIAMPVVVQGAPLAVHDLQKANDGNLYMTTYPGGPKGIKFDTKTATYTTYAQGQAEGIIAGNGTDLYFGIYPGAVIQKMNTDTLALETMFNLKTTYEQDRPYIMQFTDNKLLIGTIPDYKKLGGTLTIYDTLTKVQKTYRNIVQDQSIVGIAYKDGKIYGSTAIRGGLDIAPTAEKAKMFVWDVATEKVIKEIDLTSLLTDLDKPPMISGLTFDKDGLLWGAVDGYIFAMNPDTYEIVKSKNVYPNIKNRGMWRPVHILWGEDGLLYTDVGGKLTVMDPSNLNYVTLIGSGAEVDWIALAKDSSGNENIYFLENGTTNLKMIPVIEGGEIEVETMVVNVPVKNAGFDRAVKEDGSISGWSLTKPLTATNSIAMVDRPADASGKCVKLVDRGADETLIQSDLIPVQEGVEYTATVDAYLESKAIIGQSRSMFLMRFYNESNVQISPDATVYFGNTTDPDWESWKSLKIIKKAPAGAKYMRLVAGVSAVWQSPGAYFDNFKITYVGPAADQVKYPPVLNSSFETPVVNGVIPGWSSFFKDITANVSLGVSNEKSVTGNKSLKIVDRATNETVFAQSDLIPVVSGVKYTASTKLFLQDGTTTFFIRYFDESGNQVGADKDGLNIIHVASSYGQWQTVEAVVDAPAGAKYVRLFAGTNNSSITNGAYFDDFKLSYIGNIPESLAPGTLQMSGPVQAEINSEFEVAVKYFGSEAKSLYAFESLINYDSTKVEFVSAQKAGCYNTDSATMMHNSTPGAIKIVSTFTGYDVTCENGDVVILKFKTLTSACKTNITLSKDSKMVAVDSNIENLVGMNKFITVDIVTKIYEPEDINNDEKVSLADVTLVAKNVGARIVDSNMKMDVNGDGKIDISDVGLVMLRYMELDK